MERGGDHGTNGERCVCRVLVLSHKYSMGFRKIIYRKDGFNESQEKTTTVGVLGLTTHVV